VTRAPVAPGAPAPPVGLRATAAADLDFVLALERHPEQASFIGQWSRAEHAEAIARADREHWIVADAGSGAALGYLIAYDLTAWGCGAYLKRIVVGEKGAGLGRAALRRFAAHTFEELRAPYLWLAVYPHNVRGQRCYRAVGFRPFALDPEQAARHRRAAGSGREAGTLLYSLDPEAARTGAAARPDGARS
jgi:diamine N-acetyltransferase